MVRREDVVELEEGFGIGFAGRKESAGNGTHAGAAERRQGERGIDRGRRRARDIQGIPAPDSSDCSNRAAMKVRSRRMGPSTEVPG